MQPSSNIGLRGYEHDSLIMMYENFEETDSDGFRMPERAKEWEVVEETVQEYIKIKNKVSKLSRMKRDKICRTITLWELKGLVRFTEKGCEIL